MPASNSGKVRIIGGCWKRTNIPVLNADGLRPTGDRQRETLFNWLTFLLGGFEGRSALDMFGGSGALSFEFLSRGGSRAVLCETNRRAAQFIEQTAEKLNAEGLKVIVGNSLTDVRITDSAPYDLVFIDPPFAAELQFKALKRCLLRTLWCMSSPLRKFPMKCLPLCHSVRSAASKPAPAICF